MELAERNNMKKKISKNLTLLLGALALVLAGVVFLVIDEMQNQAYALAILIVLYIGFTAIKFFFAKRGIDLNQ